MAELVEYDDNICQFENCSKAGVCVSHSSFSFLPRFVLLCFSLFLFTYPETEKLTKRPKQWLCK